MRFSEIEKTEQKLAMNPAAIENGESCRNISHQTNTKQARGIVSPKRGCCLDGLCNNEKGNLAYIVTILSLVLILIVISIFFGIRISSSSSTALLAQPSSSTPTECCPDGWIGYQRKCYYFSDRERNWTYSQNYCASFNGSLVMIDSKEEMSFLKRYKGPVDHWIGLQRMNNQEPWKWINGTIFNKWFEIRGGGEFAYINRQGVAGSSNQREKPWICSKPVHT